MSARLAGLLNRVADLFTAPSVPLTVGPDDGDSEEWMGERFIWEPGDLDTEGVPE
ncbi:hypothetical protein GCM10010372_25880 [Streptomyces tauricus]|uniref:hypothetical protein n=1 Tax=Streptomyces tauricus TaxID=68274 RepID=UPI00167C1D43|nr:hypothetical protein [Streptomyces tauricus]GHA24760.1 hypothetical protein GCM10010372_25880 [Streptomyces tauricus]